MKSLSSDSVKIEFALMQFIFSNVKALPPGMLELFGKKRETIDELIARRKMVEGKKFIEPTPEVSLLEFVSNLAEAGYELSDLFCQPRRNDFGKDFFVVRFTFTASSYSGRQTFANKETAERMLLQMCRDSIWSAEVYCNPYFENDKLIVGTFSVSVNLACRKPLIDDKGNHILLWKKDENGDKVGNEPVPVKPKKILRIGEGDISAVPAE